MRQAILVGERFHEAQFDERALLAACLDQLELHRFQRWRLLGPVGGDQRLGTMRRINRRWPEHWSSGKLDRLYFLIVFNHGVGGVIMNGLKIL